MYYYCFLEDSNNFGSNRRKMSQNKNVNMVLTSDFHTQKPLPTHCLANYCSNYDFALIRIQDRGLPGPMAKWTQAAPWTC